MSFIKIKKSTSFVFFLIIQNFLISPSFAQSQEEMRKQIEEIMKAREEMFRSLFNNNSSGDLEKQMEEMVKRFDSWPDFGGGMDVASSFDDSGWSATNTHRVLNIKVKQIKDRPLDIKINQGMITIKGDAEVLMGDQKSMMKFERSYSIPKDVDETNPEFSNTDEEITIKFKLKNAKPSLKNPKEKAPVKTKENPKEKKANPLPLKNERIPIGPSDSALSL